MLRIEGGAEVGIEFGVGPVAEQGTQYPDGPSRRIPSFGLMTVSQCEYFPRRRLTIVVIIIPSLVMVIEF